MWLGILPAALHGADGSPDGNAAHMLRAGINPKVVQERLGHHTAAFTLSTYAHTLCGMQQEAAKLVEERLLGPDPAARIDKD